MSKPETRKLFILDGFSIIHQSYYAVKSELTNPEGVPVKAVFAFLRTLHRILDQQKPSHIIVAMDAKGPSFRKELFPDYKANRKETPEDLVPQFDIINDFLDAHDITAIEKQGFEADDVIGTLAMRAEKAGFDVFLVSRDKDLKQLLTGHVKIFNPKDDSLYGTDELEKDTGLTPAQFVDFLGLQGDTSDNIPGVPGVGPKTALGLLADYGTIDGVYEHLDDIKKKKLKEKLSENKDSALLSRKLAVIQTDVPVDCDFEETAVKPDDIDRIKDIYARHGFNSMLEKLDIPLDTVEQGAYACVNTPEAFKTFLAELEKQKEFAFDTETTGTDPHSAELVGMSFSWKEGAASYLPLKTLNPGDALPFEETIGALGGIFSDPLRTIIGHNLKYDLIIMRQHGIEPAGRIFDTLIAAHLLAPAERGAAGAGLSLDALARDYLSYRCIAISDLIGKGKDQDTLDMIDLRRVTDYAAEDADVALRLKNVFAPKLDEYELFSLFEEIEMPVVRVLVEMESNGVTIDKDVLDGLSSEFGERMGVLMGEVYESAGCEFNIDSPKQLSEILFNKLKLPTVKKTKTGFSTDHYVLETLARKHPLPAKILEYRTLAKLKNTYVDVLGGLVNKRTGRVHTSFNQAVTATGRLSSSRPNLQNIPIRSEEGRRIRAAFTPGEDGWKIMTADYSQVELRVLAHFSGDESLCTAFQNDRDIHSAVAAELFDVAEALVTREQRGVAKAVNFGIIYGQSAFGLARSLGITNREAQEFIDGYFARYSGVRRFIDSCIEEARGNGFVKTLSGRRRAIADINAKNKARRAFAERTAVNTVVQGTAADLIKIAMKNIHEKIKHGASTARLVLQIHDELVFEVEEAALDADKDFVEKEMTSAMELDVPLKVTVVVARSWLEAK